MTCAKPSAVVPAKVGTYNHRREYGSRVSLALARDDSN